MASAASRKIDVFAPFFQVGLEIGHISSFLGQEIFKGHQLQYVIPAGYWFGIYSLKGSKYSLYSASVSPGFEYDDFIDGDKEQLLKQFPNAKDIINFIMD